MGEATNPGPTNRRRRRLRPLPWSWDSDSESDADPRQSCEGALPTQVDSCSDVPPELLDAIEHNLAIELPRRRVTRAFNIKDIGPIVSTGRFHVFSHEDEHRHTISSSDHKPLIPSNRVDPHESVTQPPSGLLPTWVDEPQIHSNCEADRTGMHSVMAAAIPASQVGRDCGRVVVVETAPQRRRLKLLGGSQDTTVGMPSNASPVCGHVRSGGSSVLTFLGAGSSVPSTEMQQDLSAPSCSRYSLEAARGQRSVTATDVDSTAEHHLISTSLHRGRREPWGSCGKWRVWWAGGSKRTWGVRHRPSGRSVRS